MVTVVYEKDGITRMEKKIVASKHTIKSPGPHVEIRDNDMMDSFLRECLVFGVLYFVFCV